MANLYQFPTSTWAGTAGYTVCVAVTGSSPALLLERAESLLAGQSFLELRLDSVPDPRLVPPLLGPLLQRHPQARLIATCRRTEAGGGFTGSLADELAVLTAAAQAGCGIIDLALESAEAMRLDQHRSLRAALRSVGALLLVSYHDYRKTRDLDYTLLRLSRHQPDLVKLVSTATGLSDNLAILRMLAEHRQPPMVAIAMGEAGIVSRVLGVRAGALFTFASSGEGEQTAPGQVTAATLRELYRIGELHAATRVYGVAGQPVAHSLSPLLHNTGFGASGVDAVFLPLPTHSVDDLWQLVRELPIHGLSVTMPLKQAILARLDRVDALAAKVGACNTVVRQANGELHGYNTDVAGVTAPLEQRLGSLAGARVLVLGAGGAARAAVFGLCEKGADVWILNRTVATAAALAAEAGVHVAEPQMDGFDVLVNATPAGMHGAPEQSAVDDKPLPAKLVFDMVYRPRETPLIARARAQGLRVITGEEMFIHQGARQFELWTGETAPEEAMRRAVVEALGG
jgi:3-dehydroquinate dehydratase/shikimate dehydrogenase